MVAKKTNGGDGKRIGYVRVSSADQNDARQLDGVALEKIFTDKASGKNTDRPQLQAMLESRKGLAAARPGQRILRYFE